MTRQPSPFARALRSSAIAIVVCVALVLAAVPSRMFAASASASQKTVHVKEYTKKDGTVVKAHDRKAPGSSDTAATPKPAKAAESRPTPPPVAHASRTRCQDCDRDEHGKIVRSQDAKRAFMRATGFPNGRPGFVIDHIVPLACHGADLPSNMQWQTTSEAAAKDKTERHGCR